MVEESSIWTEKYRPKTFEEFKGQKDILNKVESFVKKGNMPHLLFSGPAGVGKTTLSLIIARQLFGENWRDNVLELNASDERGIDVIRIKVKDFAKTRSLGNVPFKIIYLDECDALTRDAQQALRRTMENYTKTTRFILSCNYSSKIIDPIQSRCAIFRFRHLDSEDVFKIIDEISIKENIALTPEAKKLIYKISEGDVRRLENLLQSASSISEQVDENVVLSLASFAKPEEIKELIKSALARDFNKARSLLFALLHDKGLSGVDIIKQIQQEVNEIQVNPLLKLRTIEKCADAEFRIIEGSDEFIQLEALIASISLLSYRVNSGK
ncbi:MAG: replication factor C small subunit [Candidatus Woesearchaeota archaeon]